MCLPTWPLAEGTRPAESRQTSSLAWAPTMWPQPPPGGPRLGEAPPTPPGLSVWFPGPGLAAFQVLAQTRVCQGLAQPGNATRAWWVPGSLPHTPRVGAVGRRGHGAGEPGAPAAGAVGQGPSKGPEERQDLQAPAWCRPPPSPVSQPSTPCPLGLSPEAPTPWLLSSLSLSGPHSAVLPAPWSWGL